MVLIRVHEFIQRRGALERALREAGTHYFRNELGRVVSLSENLGDDMFYIFQDALVHMCYDTRRGMHTDISITDEMFPLHRS